MEERSHESKVSGSHEGHDEVPWDAMGIPCSLPQASVDISVLEAAPVGWSVSPGRMAVCMYLPSPCRRFIWNKRDLDFDHFPLRFRYYEPRWSFFPV